jgi:DUF971 family protein
LREEAATHTLKATPSSPLDQPGLLHAQRLQVLFSDGNTFSYPAEYLRVMSPSADTRARVCAAAYSAG